MSSISRWEDNAKAGDNKINYCLSATAPAPAAAHISLADSAYICQCASVMSTFVFLSSDTACCVCVCVCVWKTEYLPSDFEKWAEAYKIFNWAAFCLISISLLLFAFHRGLELFLSQVCHNLITFGWFSVLFTNSDLSGLQQLSFYAPGAAHICGNVLWFSMSGFPGLESFYVLFIYLLGRFLPKISDFECLSEIKKCQSVVIPCRFSLDSWFTALRQLFIGFQNVC